jgi:formylmethanofuran dehydrogenase subunit C
MREVDCEGLTVRQINAAIRRLLDDGERDIIVRHPAARHNLAVATLTEARITVDGPVGYYCAGMSDGAHVEIHGSAGWGVAECLLAGTVIVDGNAGNSAAASIRGGAVVIRGDAGARAGVAMKGGLLVISGVFGFMTGFMMQRGTIVVCGDAAEAVADSMCARRPTASRWSWWRARLCWRDGRFTRVDKAALLEELAGSLRAPLTPEEEDRRRLSRVVFPVVKAFYDGWLDEDARVPFYRPSSLV